MAIYSKYEVTENLWKWDIIHNGLSGGANTDGHDNISHYRIDKMTDVKLLKIPAKPKREIVEFNNGFNLPRHMAKYIYMFSGESILPLGTEIISYMSSPALK